MTPFNLEVPSAARAALRANLAQNGLPAFALDEVTDLAIAAASDALSAIDRVGCRATSDKAQVTIVSLALSLAGTLCQSYVVALGAAANQLGMRVVETSVNIGGQTQ